jgi:adenosylhomocysteine nucleosidase
VSTKSPHAMSRAGLELTINDPCVVFALSRESRPFCRDFQPHQHIAGAPCRARTCGPAWLPVVVMETGVGQVRTDRAISWLLGRPKVGDLPYQPKLVVSAGFCGALQDELRTGDVILATDIVDAVSGESWPTTWPGELPPGRWEPPLHHGRIVTVPTLAATAERKRALGNDWHASAVEMEAAALAGLCQQSRVPFGCVRVVLDEAATPLSPRLIALLSASRASPWRMAGALASAPQLLPELLSLAKRSSLAANELGKALGELLTLTLPWMQE